MRDRADEPERGLGESGGRTDAFLQARTQAGAHAPVASEPAPDDEVACTEGMHDHVPPLA
jgi:hypothetical protein